MVANWMHQPNGCINHCFNSARFFWKILTFLYSRDIMCMRKYKSEFHKLCLHTHKWKTFLVVIIHLGCLTPHNFAIRAVHNLLQVHSRLSHPPGGGKKVVIKLAKKYLVSAYAHGSGPCLCPMPFVIYKQEHQRKRSQPTAITCAWKACVASTRSSAP